MSEISNKVFCFKYTKMSYFGKYQNFPLPPYALSRCFFSVKILAKYLTPKFNFLEKKAYLLKKIAELCCRETGPLSQHFINILKSK